jgi:hypothetical protein
MIRYRYDRVGGRIIVKKDDDLIAGNIYYFYPEMYSLKQLKI